MILLLKKISRRLGMTPIIKRLLGMDNPPPPAVAAATHASAAGPTPDALAYGEKLRNEQAHFAVCENVHNLPAIFHYWSNKYLLPDIVSCGFANPDLFFALYLEKTFGGDVNGSRRFISIGAGNCDTEVGLAVILQERGYRNFTIECLDINATMLARGEALAREKGVAERIRFVRGDFNSWRAGGRYDAVIANQSLHHVVALENLFAAIAGALNEGGVFITSDMIGRNGHLRWPEARAIVEAFWAELPIEKRYNLQMGRQETQFLDWDCSVEGFEGIRSQDVLPQLLAHFEFEFFYAFGNVIDPFVDRSFGHHLDEANAWDRDFIDRIHARDVAELAAGNITPTHMFAVLKNGVPGKCNFSLGRGPAESVRHVA
ncbi:MAG: class I SAM-dependent methyltransferase [Betaproteobacteria bacterium]